MLSIDSTFRFFSLCENVVPFLKMTPLVLCAWCGAASASWTIEKPKAWSRTTGAVQLSDATRGAFTVRHDAITDWCVDGGGCIPVRPGDTFRWSCTSKALPDVPEACPYSLNVILRNDKGEVLRWTYGARYVKPGEPNEITFMVPAGTATIEPRVTGGGRSGVTIENLRLDPLENRAPAVRDVPAQLTLTSPALSFTFFREGTRFAVTDRRTGRTWTTENAVGAPPVARAVKDAQTLRLTLFDPETLRTYEAAFALAADRPELLVTVSGEGAMSAALNFPAAFTTRRGDRLIVPMNEGISYPVDEPDDLPSPLVTYSGHGLCMSFYGVTEDASGAGYMGLIETADDAAVAFTRGRNGLYTAAPEWHDQKHLFGYPRRVRFVFFERGGYVAMCKRYRRWAQDSGRFKSFAEKAKERPNVDRLLGAVNIWCWDKDKLAVVSNLVAAGIDRFLWSGDGSPAEVKAIAANPKLLVSRYDVYQDIYRPEQLKALGWTSGPNTSAWPKDVIWNSANSNDWRHAWGVKTKDGTWTHCAMMCDRCAPAHERRNVKHDLATKPFNTRFVDTTVAAPWQTCYNPAHPMTRTDSREAKMELLRLLGDEFGLVVGSETGHDASVPFCDYFEGMLSLVFYRVPNSGRNIHQIWTNAPARVVKYQVGEKYRLPLWELVYHECVCAHWYWGDYNNKLPELWEKRDLFNMLYGTMGMFMFNGVQWQADREKFVKSYRRTSPIARATGYSEMTDHQILTPDRTVQRTRFANGTEVTVNFGPTPWRTPEGHTIPARDAWVRHGNQCRKTTARP